MVKTNTVKQVEGLSDEQRRMAFNIAYKQIENTTTLRQQSISKLLNPGLDIDYECRYPTSISKSDYKRMYDREGMAARVVGIYPDECWAMPPEIFETEEADKTTFELEWDALEKERSIFHYLQRVDVLSGIGEFGLLLLGLSDGGELKEPVQGIDEKTGEKVGNNKHKLLYLKPLEETVIEIKAKETDTTSSRYGLPTMYSVQFQEGGLNIGSDMSTKMIHWTRVLHIADNRLSSDVYGIPRMQAVYNRLLDVRKIVSGSGEMFWRGGYPGTFFGIDDEAATDWDDTAEDAFKEQIKLYANSMQRYIALAGIKEVKTMAPQIADPKGHIDAQVSVIAMSLGVPKRIFLGSEIGQLASTTDAETWNKRVSKRRESYISPMLIRLFIDRMMIYGVLSEVKDYKIKWPDLETPSDKDKAEVGKIKTEAFAKYVQGEVDSLIGPKDYLMKIHEMTEEEAAEIEKNAIERVAETEGDKDKNTNDNEE